MHVSPRILFLLGLVVWGTFFFELSFDVHFAVAGLLGLEPFSAAALEARHAVDGVTLLGTAIGFGVFGILADRFGRFRLLLWCLALAPAVSALAAISLTIVDFALLRFSAGALLGGLLLSWIVLLAESRDPISRWGGLAPAVVIVLFLGQAVPLLLPDLSWPMENWRATILVTILPGLFVPVFRRFHDETKPWKLAVRDASKKTTVFSGLFPELSRHRRRLAMAVLLALAAWSVTYGLDSVLRDRLRHSIRFETALRNRDKNDRLEDAALLAFLLRYPQLLGTKEVSQLDLSMLPEKSTPTADGLLRSLFEGLSELRTGSQPVDRDSLIDKALARWVPEHTGGLDGMPLGEINRFWHAAELLLADGETWLEEKNIVPDEPRGSLSGANLWEARKAALKTLLFELGERQVHRIAAENRALGRFFCRFLLGGLVGTLLLSVAVKRRFGIRNALPFFGVICLIDASGLPFFSPSPTVTEYAGLNLYVPLLGFCTIPFFAGLCGLLPRLFPCRVRATETGLALALGGVISLFLFLVPSSGWSAAAIPVTILPALVVIFSRGAAKTQTRGKVSVKVPGRRIGREPG